MVSFRTTVLALASALVVSADYVIDPNSVDLATRRAWCNDELSTCPIICQQDSPGPVMVNSCDPESLTYGCICSNGIAPNMSEYSLTLPYHVCQERGTQCVEACGMNNACASSCREDHPCGAQNPQRVNTTSSSTIAATATGSQSTGPAVFTGLAGSGNSNSNPSGSAASALQFGSSYGLVVVIGCLIGGFALVL